MFARRLMKLAIVAGLASAVMEPASAADVFGPRGSRTPERLPLAWRTLSHHSAAVLASDACWRGCTTQCGWHFQACLRGARLDGCVAHNNACELTCLRHCRLAGGPLAGRPLVGGALW